MKLEGTLYRPKGKKITHINLVIKIKGESGYRILWLHPMDEYDYQSTGNIVSEDTVKEYLDRGTILDVNLSEVVRGVYNETR